VIYPFNIAIDIDKETSEKRNMLQAIVEKFEGHVYVASPDYHIEFIDPALIQSIGRKAAGDICHEIIYGRTTPCDFCVMGQIQQGKTMRFEAHFPQNGRRYSGLGYPLCRMDGRISLLAMIMDLGDCKNAENSVNEPQADLQAERFATLSRAWNRHHFGGIVGKSEAMQKIYDLITSTAESDATVIIYGEPGTGKELVARAIHDMSGRNGRQFVPIHCGAIPENLVESEFFGYKKGAFSGAHADKPGYMDFGNGGTLFLDEVGEIPLHMQVKLLRLIEGGGYTPVGSSQIMHADVRIIAATNCDMKLLVKKKRIREDFYYRIHILPIYLPRLQDRKEDIPLLVDHFMRIHAEKHNVHPLTQDMLDSLCRYDWPGNVRELQSVIIRYCNLKILDFFEPSVSAPLSVNFCESAKISFPVDMPQPGDDLGSLVEAYEKQVLLMALEQCRWRRQQVADLLQIDRKTLFNKIKRYRLSLPFDSC